MVSPFSDLDSAPFWPTNRRGSTSWKLVDSFAFPNTAQNIEQRKLAHQLNFILFFMYVHFRSYADCSEKANQTSKSATDIPASTNKRALAPLRAPEATELSVTSPCSPFAYIHSKLLSTRQHRS